MVKEQPLINYNQEKEDNFFKLGEGGNFFSMEEIFFWIKMILDLINLKENKSHYNG